MSRLRKLIWASWFIGTGLVLLSWLRLVSNDVGWIGTYIAAAGWLVSLATSRQSELATVANSVAHEPQGPDSETLHEYRRAITKLTRRLDNAPENRSALLASRGAYYRAIENWTAAIADLSAAISVNPSLGGNVYFDRAIALFESGEYDHALVDVNKALNDFGTQSDSESEATSARLWRHYILLGLERYESVVDDCNSMLESQTTNATHVRLTRGQALTAMGRNIESLADLCTVVGEVNEDDSHTLCSALHARAGAYLRMGDVENAAADINRLQAIQGPTAENMSLMGLTECRSNDFRAALNCYQRAKSLDPSRANTYSQLALINAACPDEKFRNGSKAEVNARKACELTKWDDWTHISVLAAAKAELGDFDQAIEFAEWALRLAPEREKGDQQKRIEQYRNKQPFRINDALPRTTFRRNHSHS